MTTADLFERAMTELRLRTGAHIGLWHLDEMDWAVDQESGIITFSHANGTRASAPVQIVGSLNTADSSWLWATANSSVRPELTEHAGLAQAELGHLGASELAQDRQQASEDRAWEYAALAAMLGGAQGVYRGPAGTALIFMTFGELSLKMAQA